MNMAIQSINDYINTNQLVERIKACMESGLSVKNGASRTTYVSRTIAG